MAFSEYWRLVRSEPRFLTFAWLMTCASSAGQTYFIGVFGPAIRADFGLSHTEWGGVYLAGTLASAFALTWTGAQIDRMRLRRFSTLVVIAMVVACLVTAVTPGPLFLAVSIFLLRQSGQGLASHTGLTATARHFAKGRGKALALVLSGYACGQAVLPFLAVQMIDAVGWRATYGLVGLSLAVGLLPMVLILLRRHVDDHLIPLDAAPQPAVDLAQSSPDAPAEAAADPVASRSRRQVLADWRFYLLLPAILAPSFIDTAMFFHHPALAAAKGWSLEWLTGSYWAYSIGTIAAALLSGPVIDRITAGRTMPVMLAPIIASLAVVAVFAEAAWALPYLLLVGVTGGLSNTTTTALWPELYGVRHLGAIKAMATAIQVFATACGPVTLGVMIDAGMGFESIAAVLAAYCVAASGVLMIGLRCYRNAATVAA
jgi:MFS family permease